MLETPYVLEQTKHETHFEQVVPQLFNKKEEIKYRSYMAMDQLDGWCSKEKASILIDFIMLLRAKTIVEIGVFGGKSLVPMALALKGMGNGTIYGVDPWTQEASIVGMDGANKDWWGHLDHDMIYRNLVSKIKTFDLEHNVVLIRDSSINAPAISNIDILHIDGNHSDEAAMIDVTKWVPYVRKGGLIIFDDINWNNKGLAVQWLDENCVQLMEFSAENVWGIWIKP